MTATPFYNRGGGEHNEGKRTLAYYPKIDDKYCFLDAMASLESMLESELSFQQIQMIWKYYDDELRSAITKVRFPSLCSPAPLL